MAKRVGKYKISKKESALSIIDGGDIQGDLTVEGVLSLGGNLTLDSTSGGTVAGSLQEVKTGDVGTLNAGDSGALISLSGGARTLVLPAVATAGVNFTIVAGSTHDHIISCSSGELTKLQGVVIDSGNASTVASALITSKTAVTLGNGTIGDRIEVVSDGTYWHTTMWLKDTPTFS